MINIFQSDYNYRIREWKSLRIEIRTLPMNQLCVMVDDWWQQAPLINHHLHWADSDSWPDPWTILSENIYCPLTRAIGMCYTLLMSDITEVNLITACDHQAEEHHLVVVGNAKYVLNYHPKSVLSTSLADFSVVRELSTNCIRERIK